MSQSAHDLASLARGDETISLEPPPARTTIQSDLPGFEIEVDAVLFVDA
jgi:hypothetical protein